MTPSSTPPVSPWEERVRQAIGRPARLGVAFSGGVDSALLTAVAVRHLGAESVVALLAVSPSLAADERDQAHQVAAAIGVTLVELHTNELDDPFYRANGPDRCFHCKNALFKLIDRDVVSDLGLTAIAYGENADDVKRHDRPGSAAATQHHVSAPLARAGMTKAMVRAGAAELGLAVADKPAAPCLASRIPHGQDVTAVKLRQIEQAEHEVRRLGFSDVRVRHHGDIARIELPLDEIVQAAQSPTRSGLVAAIRRAGFRYAVVDLAGLQSGAFTLSVI
ncbi:MAG: ATP-dependent sacrificial sulfur transferase LarE [Propionibacteriaceae bacterium]|jgi:uncharacterized protein|nr:ATP-dependent sacrificial sulfur transferase LarE [Propionibacteriaceae bacterium]